MIKQIKFTSLFALASLSLLNIGPIAQAQDLTPLRACARALSVNIEGDRFSEGFPSDDDESMYFITCDDNYNLGRNHYILMTNGAYHMFEKTHVDYKGGLEPTLYRFNLENKTFYFRVNIVGEMGDVFNDKGLNLSKAPVTGTPTIDTSAKNLALKFYMKTLTGRTDSKAALNAEPLSADRYSKLQSCLRKKMNDLGNSLYRTYLARYRDDSIEPSSLAKYRETVATALNHQACRSDEQIASKFEEFLATLP